MGGAILRIEREDTTGLYRVMTDRKGHYIYCVPTGTYKITLQVEGGDADSVEGLHLSPGAPSVQNFDLRKPSQAAVANKVTEKPQIPAPSLRLPSTYVSAQNPADKLQLKADSTFSLQEGGETYSGNFVANGSTLKLNITGGTESVATVHDNTLTDSSGQTWVLGEASAPPATSGPVLQNQDVIKMVNAGLDDGLILAKISSSRCQFDTSTDALIQLKQSGASAAVLKAVLAAGK